MRYDDPSVFWDSDTFFYDMPDVVVHHPHTTMAKPKLNLRGLSTLQKVQKTNDIVAALTGNTNFTTPSPTLAAVTASSDGLSAAYSAREDARMTLDEKQTLLENAEDGHDTVLNLLMAYVENASGGDEAKILSAGFEVKGRPTPVGEMPQVDGLDSIIGDAEGRVILRWKSIKGAKSYEVQTCPDPISAAGWKAAGITTRASLTLDGLPTGGRCWFRVRAIGSAGPGPWSDPAVKTVP
ncbi:MAG: fibronectin type III domain-containing protein [Verrucomicrobiaceae bacterium]